MKALRFVILALMLLGLVGTTSAQTRYVFGVNSFTDTSGTVWSPIPLTSMSGVQGVNWRASTCANSSMGLYGQQYLYMTASGTITVPVPLNTYTVNMYFFDPCAGSPIGARVFSLAFNGVVIDPSLDIVKEAGGAQKPLTKTGTVTGSSVVVQINLLSGSNPIFAALEILPAAKPPVISTQPQAQTVARGQTATFSVVATGSQLAYQWKKNGVAIAGATAASYTTPQTLSADSGASFTVAVSNAGGSVASSAATLTVRTSATLDNGATQFVTTLPGYDALANCGTVACTSAVAAGGSGTASEVLTISVAGTTTPLSITTTTLPGATVGLVYSAQLAAVGGKAPYTWSITAGQLPAGLALSTAGLISGTPTTPSATPVAFTVQVKDSSGLAAKKSFGRKKP